MYVSTNSGMFAAVNLKTGRTAWKYLAHRCVAASPAIGPQHHGSVFAVFLNRPPCNAQTGGHGTNGAVIDFGVGFGKIRWTKIIGPSETSPLLLGDRLYVGDWNGNVWAIDARNGKTIWRFHTGGAVKGGVAYAGGKLYVGSYDGHVYCLSLAGKKIWKAAAEPRLYGHSQFYSTPAVAYGRVYIGSTDGKVYSYGATTGKLRWSHGTGGYVYGSPAVARDLVFAGSFSKRFFAFDAATGDEKWSFTANGPIAGSATVVGDLVYFATLKRRTYALERGHGQARLDVRGRQVLARWSPRAGACSWSASARCMGWFPADALRRHRRRRLRRLAARGRARRRGPRGGGRRLLHRLLRPGREGARTRRSSTSAGSTSRRTRSTSTASTASSISPRRPGVRSFGGVFPLYVRRNILATQRVLEAAAAARVRVVLASSSSVYGEAEAYPTPEDAVPRPISPYGITKLACEHLARAYAVGFGLDAVVLRYFTVYGPRQRPDMFFRRVCDALLDGVDLRDLRQRASSRAASRTSGTRSRRRSRRWSGRRAEPSTTSAAATRRRCSRRSRCSSGSPAGRLDVAARRPPPGATSRGRRRTSRGSADALGWEPRTTLADGLAAMWSWASGRVAAA